MWPVENPQSDPELGQLKLSQIVDLNPLSTLREQKGTQWMTLPQTMMPGQVLNMVAKRHCSGGDTDFTHKNEVFDTDMWVFDMGMLPTLKCLCIIGPNYLY